MEMYSQVSSCFQRTGEVTDRSSNDKVELLLDKLTLYWYHFYGYFAEWQLHFSSNYCVPITTKFKKSWSRNRRSTDLWYWSHYHHGNNTNFTNACAI